MLRKVHDPRAPFGRRCLLVAGALGIGCTTMLGIDDDYTVGSVASAGAGAAATGGTRRDASAGTGTATATGGSTAGRADAATDGRDAGRLDSGMCGNCPQGTKCCVGRCEKPAPIVGCSLEGCDPCPPPPDRGVAVCVEGRCDIKCNAFTARIGNTCQTSVTGGAGGTGSVGGAGGAGGAGGMPLPECIPEECTGCGPVGPFGCCKNDGSCGCSWTASGSLCY